MSSDYIWQEGAMKARIWSAPSGGESSEWESGLEIFKHDKMVGTAREGDKELWINDDFSDYKETGKMCDDGLPEFKNDSIYLSISDLKFIAQALEDWSAYSYDLPSERWKDDSG